MILIVGSTGYLGSSVSRKLAAAGQPVTGLVRDPAADKAKALAGAGVKLVTGDLKAPRTLDGAFAGVRTVICTASATLSRRDGDSIESVDHQGVQSLITAAGKAGVRDFIFVSFDSAGRTYPLAQAKQAAEQRLRNSTLNWTILQPACFCEVWLSPAVGFDVAGGKVRIYGEGDKPVNYIALDDVAKATVASVDNRAASRKTFRFGGATPASQLEAVRLFEQATGRKFTLERMSVAEIKAAQAGATDPITASFLGLFEQVATGGFGVDSDWQTALGVRPQTLREWIQGNLHR